MDLGKKLYSSIQNSSYLIILHSSSKRCHPNILNRFLVLFKDVLFEWLVRSPYIANLECQIINEVKRPSKHVESQNTVSVPLINHSQAR